MVQRQATSSAIFAVFLLIGCAETSSPATRAPEPQGSGGMRAVDDAMVEESPSEPEGQDTPWIKPADRPCVDGDQGMDTPLIRATTVGADESRTDYCDMNGNLIDHVCEVIEFGNHVCGCAGECGCGAQVTGRVIPDPFDCKGGCVDGACQNWCPDGGDRLSIGLAAGGSLHVENLTKALLYACLPQASVPDARCLELARYEGIQDSPFGYWCFGPDAAQIFLRLLPVPPEVADPQSGDLGQCPFDCTRVTGP